MTDKTSPLTISVMLAVADATAASAWYQRALGAIELWSLGSVVGLAINGAPFFVAEPAQNGWDTPAILGRPSCRVEVFCDDPDALVARAVRAGATGNDVVRDHQAPWGVHRQGGFVDPFGHIWLVGDHSPLRGMAVVARRFVVGEWPLYRELRLRALQESSHAFGSTYEHEVQQTDTAWVERLTRGVTSASELPLVAEVGGVPAGLAWARVRDEEPGVVHLYQMWVAPEHRMRGVGRVLVDSAIAWARSIGASALILDVTAGNGPARRLYEGVGFVPFGEEKPLRSGSTIMSQSMRLALR
jgi:PhnB protein